MVYVINNPEVTIKTKNIIDTIEAVKKNLTTAQEMQVVNYNKYHQDIQFDISNKVLLSTKNLKLTTLVLSPLHKFLSHFIRSFIILAKVSLVTYSLNLLATIQIYLMFY